jgi:glycosyltransferase involved in cell wall biosynthesis
MKILSIINISNPDDLECDSGVIFQKILASEFVKKKDLSYVILGPDSQAFKSIEFSGCRKQVAKLGNTRYESRFSFDWTTVKYIIEIEKPDVIFNNQVELTSAIRSLLVTLKNTTTRIVTYCHYPAIWSIDSSSKPILDGSLNHENLGVPIIFRILSALLTTDIFITQSHFAKYLLTQTALYHRLQLHKEITVIPPPADPSLTKVKLKAAPKSKQILYNHRLYESYGTNEFLQFIQQSEALDFELIISDPMPSRSKERLSLNNTPDYFRKLFNNLPYAKTVNGNISRDKYAKIIGNSRLAFASMRKACVWSMAAIDCMDIGVPVLAPRYAAYPEFIPSELLFDTKEGAYSLLEKLLNDDNFWKHCSKRCQDITQNFSSSIIADRFYKSFQKSSRETTKCVV